MRFLLYRVQASPLSPPPSLFSYYTILNFIYVHLRRTLRCYWHFYQLIYLFSIIYCKYRPPMKSGSLSPRHGGHQVADEGTVRNVVGSIKYIE